MDEQTFFHLTGTRSGEGLAAIGELGLRPALFARVADLARLRYDFPVVLLDDADGEAVRPLVAIVDEVLRDVAPRGPTGERLRRHVLRAEREVAALAREAGGGGLSLLWERATERLAPVGGDPLRADLAVARAALRADGLVLDCDADLPARAVTHLWRALQERRARKVRAQIDGLATRLADLVKADLLRSGSGRGAPALRAGVGGRHHELFDFDVMAGLLAKPSGSAALPPSRRARIAETLATLRAQRFFGGPEPFELLFDDADSALEAHRERLPAMAALVRAMAIAELELQGRYVEPAHEEYFRTFDERSLEPSDLALFPDLLVRLDGRRSDAGQRAQVLRVLASETPLKILLVTDDAFGLDARLATTAMGLGTAFVVQAPSSHLARIADRIVAAIEHRGPALLSVFSGAGGGAQALPAYLVAAAALESRAFPAFSYDPAAGPDWAHRFVLEANPQPQRPWPVHELTYSDANGQRVRERVPVTPADLALCDPHRAPHFARVAPDRWNGHLVPAGDWIADQPDGAQTLPCVLAIDAGHRLHKLVIDARLAQDVRRASEAWRRLGELDELRRARFAPPAPVAAPVPEPAAVAVAVAAGPAQAPAVTAEAAPVSDDPYIETPRCTTCNECTLINNRMFAYDDNKQAYIKDPDAGTFRELVEAAESCQVAIIHPGTPRNPKEPGLDELVRRAEEFR